MAQGRIFQEKISSPYSSLHFGRDILVCVLNLWECMCCMYIEHWMYVEADFWQKSSCEENICLLYVVLYDWIVWIYSSSWAGYMAYVSPLFTCSFKVLFTYSVEGYTLKSCLLDWYSIVIELCWWLSATLSLWSRCWLYMHLGMMGL